MIYKAISAYSAASQTLPKINQVIMLYDGAINSVVKAKQAIEQQDYEQRYNLIAKAIEIIDGLQSSLDFDNGGSVAKTLFDYYASVLNELGDIQMSNSLAMCDSVITELKNMKDVWNQIKDSESASSSQSNHSAIASNVSNTNGMDSISVSA